MVIHLLSQSCLNPLIINQIEECFPEKNLYLLFSEDKSLEIDNTIYGNNVILPENLQSTDISKSEGIIIHYLSISKARFLRKIPQDIPVACSIWGGDFYNFLPEFRKDLYSDLTEKYLKHAQKWPGILYLIKDKMVFPVSQNYKLWKEAVTKSKLFSTVIPYEKILVGKSFNANSKYMSLPTHSLDKVLDIDNYERTICTKENFSMNILIGNSGHPTNNHLEILYFIQSLNNEEINVHLPLTYGNNEYIKHLCNTGSSLFGKKFRPLLNHLNNTDFKNYLNYSNIFIFNSYRQQGIGTIIEALWSGGKVFLSNKNITASFYRDIGLKIFSVEDDLFKSKNPALFEPLTREEILSNRKILLKIYSKEMVNNSIINFITNLTGALI
jgi:hypothetical protein